MARRWLAADGSQRMARRNEVREQQDLARHVGLFKHVLRGGLYCDVATIWQAIFFVSRALLRPASPYEQ